MPICGEYVGLVLLPYVYIYPEGHADAGDVIKIASTAGVPWPGYPGPIDPPPTYPGDPAYPGDAEYDAVVDPPPVIRYQQPFIIMVPVPCCLCDETAWAGIPLAPEDTNNSWPDEDSDGYKYEFPGNDWSMYFSVPEDPDVAAPVAASGKKK